MKKVEVRSSPLSSQSPFTLSDRTGDILKELIKEVDKVDENPVFSEPEKVRIAIIIDDFGWDLNSARSFLELSTPLTFSVLPNRTYSLTIAEEAYEKERDVLLHLPMEPYGYPATDPGRGALLLSMTTEELKEQLHENISSIPYLVGINHHMGSRLCEDEEKMAIIMKEVSQKDLFFVDSLTSKKSVVFKMAKEAGVKTAKRNVFLDNEIDVEYIQRQLMKLADLAKKTGRAIGIGHPYRETLIALQQALPAMEERGIEVVPVSLLVD